MGWTKFLSLADPTYDLTHGGQITSMMAGPLGGQVKSMLGGNQQQPTQQQNPNGLSAVQRQMMSQVLAHGVNRG